MRTIQHSRLTQGLTQGAVALAALTLLAACGEEQKTARPAAAEPTTSPLRRPPARR